MNKKDQLPFVIDPNPFEAAGEKALFKPKPPD
jgi:hypothetical protein